MGRTGNDILTAGFRTMGTACQKFLKHVGHVDGPVVRNAREEHQEPSGLICVARGTPACLLDIWTMHPHAGAYLRHTIAAKNLGTINFYRHDKKTPLFITTTLHAP
jgi:hypothetical protein